MEYLREFRKNIDDKTKNPCFFFVMIFEKFKNPAKTDLVQYSFLL